jgi:hypothetical protein
MIAEQGFVFGRIRSRFAVGIPGILPVPSNDSH